jgi:DNA-binding transcriptional ArsR family regulator
LTEYRQDSRRHEEEGALPGSTLWQRASPDHGFADPLLDLIAARFRLLGEPLRLKLLAALTERERSVGELVTLTGAGQPNVSRHLAALMQGGLVKRRKVGTSIRYALADPGVLTLCNIVCAGVQERFAELARTVSRSGAEQGERPWTSESEDPTGR